MKINEVDQNELEVYSLSHGYQAIIDHFQLDDMNHDRLNEYMRKGRRRKDIIGKKSFPSPYQTIPRDELPDGEDTVVGLAKKGTPCLNDIWHGEEIPQQLKDEYQTYRKSDELRKQLLPVLERCGYVENHQDSPYGLLYRQLDEVGSIIPDFLRLNTRHIRVIKLIVGADRKDARYYRKIVRQKAPILVMLTDDDVKRLTDIAKSLDATDLPYDVRANELFKRYNAK